MACQIGSRHPPEVQSIPTGRKSSQAPSRSSGLDRPLASAPRSPATRSVHGPDARPSTRGAGARWGPTVQKPCQPPTVAQAVSLRPADRDESCPIRQRSPRHAVAHPPAGYSYHRCARRPPIPPHGARRRFSPDRERRQKHQNCRGSSEKRTADHDPGHAPSRSHAPHSCARCNRHAAPETGRHR